MADITKIVSTYLKIRDHRAILKREYEEADAKFKHDQGRLEAVLMDFFNKSNVDSVKTPVGTVYRQEDIIPQGSDWGAFYEWVIQHNALDAFERRIKKAFIREYMENNNGEVPPGVSLFRSYDIRVRRS